MQRLPTAPRSTLETKMDDDARFELDRQKLVDLGNRYSERFLKLDSKPDAGDAFKTWLCELIVMSYMVGVSSRRKPAELGHETVA